ncbi:hypothetical protein QCA50_009570 [Cerrena zonata]|uniref:lytic cellulose monooxygenase (C4-dehydrogenating) n=1 Tax=Cerrena zonata TaxID=2478898 RepID=A0AAW0GDD2_9APHY
MFQLLPIAALSLSLATIVKGHGFVHEVVVNGKSYPGYAPFTDPYASPAVQRIVRKVTDDGPVTDIHDASLACNVAGDKPAALVADAPAGSKVTFNWQNWPADHLGPVSTYMASCNGDCTKFSDPSSAKWFKIDAAGYDSSKKQWASAKLIADGASWTSTIPASLAAGQYLIRHEIVALHSTGQPQFYPACAQVKVTGSGNAKATDTVAIPGLYDNVKFPDIWADGFNKFTAPGPAVFASSGSDQQTAPASSAAPAEPSSTKSASPSSSAAASPSAKPPASATAALPASAPIASSTLVSAAPATSGRCRRSKRHVRHASRHH